MKNNMLLKRTSILMITGLALAFSCKDEDRVTVQDTQDITEEAVTDSYFQDMDDMAGVAVEAPSDAEFSGGRGKGTIIVNDTRFTCAGTPLTVTLERGANSTPQIPQGVITVDFGTTGCEDSRGNIRKGKLIFTYNGRRFITGSTVVTTGVNYTINDVKLEGTRTVTNVTGSSEEAPRFNVVLDGGKATFEDGRTAERESNITVKWIRGANPLSDKLIVEAGSTAEGTTRGGRGYSVSILEQLEFQRACGIAVNGIKRYVIDGTKDITIDYGDGTCDKAITITVNGITRNITVR